LSAADLDQVVLHEFGHVQRRDDWMRLLQALIEAALWMHPAAALIARELNLEREVACDDWVVARTDSPLEYAACLSRVAERQHRLANPALAPALIKARRALLRRIDRLMSANRPRTRRMSRTGAAAAVAIVAAFVVSFRSLPLIAERVEMEFALDARAARVPPTRTAAGPVSPVAPAVPSDAIAAGQAVAAGEAVAAPARSHLVQFIAVTSVVSPAAPTPVETQQSDIRMLDATRSFPVLPSSPPALDRPLSVSGTPSWQRAADAGVHVGETTARAGVRLGDVFTRIGTSAGSSFRE
jgi:hypothetical protein